MGKRMIKKLRWGEIISIPIHDRIIFARVVFVSKFFKNIMLLEVSNMDLSSPINPKDFETGLLYYTSTLSITQGNWSIIGATPISDTDI
jgi:hypothetical protein